MQEDFDSDLGKWLLCRLMVKQGYSGTDVAKHMEKKEAILSAHPSLDGDANQNIKAVKSEHVESSRTL